MKLAFLLTASAAAAGGLYAGGMFSTGERYDLTVPEVRDRLKNITLPDEALSMTGGSDRSGVEVISGPDSIIWKVPTGGPRPAKFIARIEANGAANTRVTVDYEPGKSASPEMDRMLSTKFVGNYAKASFGEVVDARLDSRPVDQTAARRDFAIYAASHPEQMRELGLASKESFDDVSTRMIEMSGSPDNAGRNLGTAGDNMRAATRPSVDLSGRK